MHVYVHAFLDVFSGMNDTNYEPGELESWAEIEAQLLCDRNANRPVVSFEDEMVTTGVEFDDLAESVRNQLRSLKQEPKREAYIPPGIVFATPLFCYSSYLFEL